MVRDGYAGKSSAPGSTESTSDGGTAKPAEKSEKADKPAETKSNVDKGSEKRKKK